jgi:hypothetical protein
MRFRTLALLMVLTIPAFSQRDFLRADEVDQVRLVQEPNERLKLYLTFAQSRLSLIEQAVAQEKAGRSKMIHDLLEDYTNIIESIDTVSDDALKRGVDITEGLKAVAEAEKEMGPRLEKLRDSNPSDLQRYAFVLDTAIETTQDSAELAAEDMQERIMDVKSREKKEQQERESMMRPEEVKEKRAAEQKEAEQKKKAPTLRRKGEVVKEKP